MAIRRFERPEIMRLDFGAAVASKDILVEEDTDFRNYGGGQLH